MKYPLSLVPFLSEKTVVVTDNKVTGRNAREYRKAKHLSLRSTAKRMKISAVFLSDLERGRRNWDGHRCLAFMRAVTEGEMLAIMAAMNAPKPNLKLD